jgi:tetratricopeptide (TPR) repeat protein
VDASETGRDDSRPRYDRSVTEADHDAVTRLRAARSAAPAVEAEQALARLQSALFGAPSRPRVLDRYPLIRTLGQGGSGTVHLAYDPRLDRKVAIKLLHPRGSAAHGGSEGRARLLREAQAMARSPHPNVVAVYDVGTYPAPDAEEPGVFLVMEYVEGSDLQSWLRTPRPWRQVLDVFMAAARGLAAAHRVGVVHRDFKPANAIVGDDGRVRVLDFGLARGAGRDEDDTGRWDIGVDDTSSLDSPLTAEGTVLGTPAFMAPEQHGAETSDAAGDQYSFCVALWEGLYGARPFRGASLEALLEAKRAGPPEPPRGKAVPSFLGDVLRRGLAHDPERRHASMDALLLAIDRGLASRRRRRLWLSAGLVAPLLVSGWLFAHEEEELCTASADRIAEVWSASQRAEVEAAFSATTLPYASTSAGVVTDRLDDFGAEWALQHREACAATRVRHEQSEDLMDLRMGCLDRQRREVAALVDVLADADATTVERSIVAVMSLPRPEACAEVDALLAEIAPPSDPAVAAAVEDIRARAARAKALDDAGHVHDALALAESLAAEADALAYAPLQAETTIALGSLQSATGRWDLAAETLARGHATAIACGHDRSAARAARLLVFVQGTRRSRLELALQWAEIAEAEIVRADVPEERAALLAAKAEAYRTAGKARDAEPTLREAVALLEAHAHPGDPMRSTLHNNLGDLLRELGDLEGAEEELELAHELGLRAFGPDHPDLAMSLNNLGLVELARLRFEAAESRFREALSIRERALGPDHPLMISTLSNLGVALRRRGELEEAREIYARALEVADASGGPPHRDRAPVLVSLGLVASAQGRHDEAIARYDEAIADWEAAAPTHPDLARALHNRSVALLHTGEYAAGTSSFARALALLEDTYGDDNPAVALARFDFAVTLHHTGATAQATALARETLAKLAPGAHPELAREVEAWLRDNADD